MWGALRKFERREPLNVESTVVIFLANRLALPTNDISVERWLGLNIKPLYALPVILWHRRLLVKGAINIVPAQQLHLPCEDKYIPSTHLGGALFCPHPGTGLRSGHSVRSTANTLGLIR